MCSSDLRARTSRLSGAPGSGASAGPLYACRTGVATTPGVRVAADPERSAQAAVHATTHSVGTERMPKGYTRTAGRGRSEQVGDAAERGGGMEFDQVAVARNDPSEPGGVCQPQQVRLKRGRLLEEEPPCEIGRAHV